ncbi:tRNA-specific adenosine deaminase [Planctomycetes bacterium MalM25]|nr:tRNA-specific adenosine deaminase [Planctomycetes bacterium MalM25]
MTDSIYLARCNELARVAASKQAAAVGAVLVRDGKTLAEACESPVDEDPFGHAELMAVRQAVLTHGRQAVAGATIYSNKEPCWMCAYAIRWARVSRVVFIDTIEDIGGLTSELPILLAAGPRTWSSPPAIETRP